MAQRIDLDRARKPVKDFFRNLRPFREPLELVLEGAVVAQVIGPSELSDKDKRRLLAAGWRVIQRARKASKGISSSEIRRAVTTAVREVHDRHGQRRR